MRRLSTSCFAAFLICSILSSLPLYAQTVTSSDTAGISLEIEPWVSVEFDEGEFDLVLENGAQSTSSTLGYTAEGNVDATISITLTQIPEGAPGDWMAEIDELVFSASSQLRGTATVAVSEVTDGIPNTSYQGGIVTITIIGQLE